MVTVTIPKIKYEQLKRQANAYRRFFAKFSEISIHEPIQEIIENFRKRDLYTKQFLQSLEVGLRRASSGKWRELKEDFEDRVRCEIAIQQSRGKRRYSLKEMKKRYDLT